MAHAFALTRRISLVTSYQTIITPPLAQAKPISEGVGSLFPGKTLEELEQQ
jgi:hypothetical protein